MPTPPITQSIQDLIGTTIDNLDACLTNLKERVENQGSEDTSGSEAEPLRSGETPVAEETNTPGPKVKPAPKWRMPEAIAIELGYATISTQFVESLTASIKRTRNQFLESLGVVLPPIHLRDNLRIQPNAYRVLLQDNPVATGALHPDKRMIISPDGPIDDQFVGTRVQEPAFGLPACWVDPKQVSAAADMNYTVVDARTVLMTHLSETCRRHIDEIFGYKQLDGIFRALERARPLLIQSLRDTPVSNPILLTVFRGLLQDQVSLRQAETIIEACIEMPGAHPNAMISHCREKLARSICQQYSSDSGVLHAMTLDRGLEQLLTGAETSWADPQPNLPPKQATILVEQLSERIKTWDLSSSDYPVLLTSTGWLRAALSNRLRHALPDLVVLSVRELLPTTSLNLNTPPVTLVQPT